MTTEILSWEVRSVWWLKVQIGSGMRNNDGDAELGGEECAG